LALPRRIKITRYEVYLLNLSVDDGINMNFLFTFNYTNKFIYLCREDFIASFGDGVHLPCGGHFHMPLGE
jgi:hypothetical protein